jgi:ABC-type Na+ efflux pump permease subunit
LTCALPSSRFLSAGLLLALLSLSLLTGPLTESLAGERSRKTLLSLLTASISRGELALGKWLAWAGVSSVMTLAVALSGRVTGAMPLGLWCLGLPLASGMAAALGLWLGRDAEDEVDGAARTLRALPVIALGLFGAAYGLNMVSPGLGAVVPLGGALLLAGGLLTGVTPVIGAVLGTAIGRRRADVERGPRLRRRG